MNEPTWMERNARNGLRGDFTELLDARIRSDRGFFTVSDSEKNQSDGSIITVSLEP